MSAAGLADSSRYAVNSDEPGGVFKVHGFSRVPRPFVVMRSSSYLAWTGRVNLSDGVLVVVSAILRGAGAKGLRIGARRAVILSCRRRRSYAGNETIDDIIFRARTSK